MVQRVDSISCCTDLTENVKVTDRDIPGAAVKRSRNDLLHVP